MMSIAYIILAILVIVVVMLLARKGSMAGDPVSECELATGATLLDDSTLNLAERIFDAGDYYWLMNEIGFPELAGELMHQRKRLALAWLRCLRVSFHELVSTPSSNGTKGDRVGLANEWALTFQTIRFQILLAYALFAVRLFGPYTRIVPSFRWMHPLLERNTRKEQFGFHASAK